MLFQYVVSSIAFSFEAFFFPLGVTKTKLYVLMIEKNPRYILNLIFFIHFSSFVEV